MKKVDPYKELEDLARKIALINSSAATLSWDQQTYQPPRSVSYRAEQTSYLATMAHEMFVANEVGAWITECEAESSELDHTQASNVRNWRKAHDRAVKIPNSLVEELSRESALAHEVWAEAREKSDFSIFEPNLAKLISLSIQQAEFWGFEENRYDALLEGYETGAKTAEISELFTNLSTELTPLVLEGEKVSKDHSPSLPEGPYPIADQQAFNHKVAERLGFDFESGRVDTTAHPFCTTLGPVDVRLTTRYDESDFTSSFYGILHETGHGLYEQGLRESDFGLPSGEAVSLGIHESQSRLWENHVGRDRSFWEYWFEEAVDHFPQLKESSPEQIHQYVNRINRSHIRVEADEITYDLHIILRFEIEQKLINGELETKDLPDYWNSRFEEMFELPVSDDANGCLQDVHWSFAGFGYFPTYSLGNLNAAQLFAYAKTNVNGLESDLDDGNYGSLLSWLTENIHKHGSVYRPQDLMKNATGEQTNARYHLAHLRSKLA